MIPPEALPASFRDPSGFVFSRQGVLYRHVAPRYSDHYDALMKSGLYDRLTKAGLLVPHEEVAIETSAPAYKVLRPERITFISYPYEWCFGQLKQAALLTLEIQRLALEHELTLKDASAFNVQFRGWKPVLIDTLSFEKLTERAPWVAYGQFCRHFLAPLALMAYRDPRLSQLLRANLDGIPLDLAATLLPRRTLLKPSLLLHLHAHAGSQKHFSDKAAAVPQGSFSRNAFFGLIEQLRSTIEGLRLRQRKSEWGAYYEDIHYSNQALEAKRAIVETMLDTARPQRLWDLGANTGVFSRLRLDKREITLSIDGDPLAVERNYHQARESKEENLLPLWLDLMNPSTGIGWAGRERDSLLDRGPADTVMALALIHHLAIGSNVPLPLILRFLASMTRRTVIIEFVPKVDPQVQRMLSSRVDVFEDYSEESFLRAAGEEFSVASRVEIPHTPRVLFLLEKK